jgi:hypothetical protein
MKMVVVATERGIRAVGQAVKPMPMVVATADVMILMMMPVTMATMELAGTSLVMVLL